MSLHFFKQDKMLKGIKKEIMRAALQTWAKDLQDHVILSFPAFNKPFPSESKPI